MKNIKIRKLVLLLFDIAMFTFSYVFIYYALNVNHILKIGSRVNEFVCYLIMICCITVVRFFFRTYGSIWRYAETLEYLYLIIADFVGYCMCVLVMRLILKLAIPMYFITSVCILSLLLVLLSRIVYRQLTIERRKYAAKKNDEKKRYVAIIGGGAAGAALLKELKSDKAHNTVPYCFIDTDKNKSGSFINGVKVINPKKGIVNVIKESPITDIIIAIPSASAEKKQRIIADCAKTGCKVKMYEYIYDRNDGADKKRAKLGIRDVKIEDLLSRGVITFENENIKRQLGGKTIIVTGGGGSIGSELCRQIAKMHPKKLVILDIYENNAYYIEQELKRKYKNSFEIEVEIASVRDYEKILFIFNKHKPQFVFHAAAHKHVPLMENCAAEAVKNNIFGTHNVIEACEKTGVEKMLLISTDKAVNPSSVMGATKRFCEMMIQSKIDSKTEYVAVRFGNVLGSNGSVLPIFASQIEKGGPVTITDKRITRYFMTIPEAVSLVLQANAMAVKSEIFVLDMGKPVKILDLAENMIRLSGLKPYIDIPIVEIGLRPGEKMYEELLIKTEELDRTFNEKIFIERDKAQPVEMIDKYLDRLKDAAETNNNTAVRDCLRSIIPTFVTPNNVEAFEDTDDKELEPAN